MPQTEAEMRQLFYDLKPGDVIEVEHEVKVGLKVWPTTTKGAVVRTDRQRHSLHFDRNDDDKVYSDVIVLRREDGELTTVTIDEYTKLKRVETAK